MTRVVVVTHSFPYGTAEGFLAAEISELAVQIDEVIIAPLRTRGTARALPEGVVLDERLGATGRYGLGRGLASLWAALRSPRFYRELVEQFPRWLHWSGLARLIAAIGDIDRVARWVPHVLAEASDERTVLYTYWFGPSTLALGEGRVQSSRFALVSRAHRIDLYESEHPREYLPLRRQMLECVDRLYVVSTDGYRYVVGRHPFMASRCEVARLGVPDPGFDAAPSADGVLRVLSCSSVVEQKRIGLLIDSLAELMRLAPGLRVEWHHVGSGPGLDAARERARAALSPDVTWTFHGHLPSAHLMAMYRNMPIDVFANVSRSEGVPVSIMEALSCGVPTVATDVGGTGEIVNDDNGVLLACDPSPTDVARALTVFTRGAGPAAARREAAKETWRTTCCSKTNYTDFANRLERVARELAN